MSVGGDKGWKVGGRRIDDQWFFLGGGESIWTDQCSATPGGWFSGVGVEEESE